MNGVGVAVNGKRVAVNGGARLWMGEILLCRVCAGVSQSLHTPSVQLQCVSRVTLL